MITFLLSLMNDPLELDAFRRNPAAVIQRYSLSEEDVAAIKSGDMETISTRLAATGKYETPMMGTVPAGGVNQNVNGGLQIFAAYDVRTVTPKVNVPAVKPNSVQPKVNAIAPKSAIGSATGGAGAGKIK